MVGDVHISLSKANAIDIAIIIHPHTQSTLFVRGALWVRVRKNKVKPMQYQLETKYIKTMDTRSAPFDKLRTGFSRVEYDGIEFMQYQQRSRMG
ncbi:hypothetical protein QNI23_010480 [Bermanella sp. WJH001]|uniref:hypothetical protein n=1 Tax=Bermanella sp. WJH001 TaxID=3048005 RepID=UPI0024BE641A|nr:hypothetical protein [Bermanella sp. WJH001]MDJ1537417.1 hypothetical protein [Bermanella sp. WJH001]